MHIVLFSFSHFSQNCLVKWQNSIRTQARVLHTSWLPPLPRGLTCFGGPWQSGIWFSLIKANWEDITAPRLTESRQPHRNGSSFYLCRRQAQCTPDNTVHTADPFRSHLGGGGGQCYFRLADSGDWWRSGKLLLKIQRTRWRARHRLRSAWPSTPGTASHLSTICLLTRAACLGSF